MTFNLLNQAVATMLFYIFYTSYTLQKSIPSTDPEPADKDQLKILLREGLCSEDDFFGIIDKEGVVLQLMFVEPRQYLAEIPQPEAKRGLQLRLMEQELMDFVDNLPSNLANLDLSRFTLQEWTLDRS